MKVTFETNAGNFTAYLTVTGEIIIYEGEDETPVAAIAPIVKRRQALDLTADGIARAVRGWLEETHSRLEIESVIARLTSPEIGAERGRGLSTKVDNPRHRPPLGREHEMVRQTTVPDYTWTTRARQPRPPARAQSANTSTVHTSRSAD